MMPLLLCGFRPGQVVSLLWLVLGPTQTCDFSMLKGTSPSMTVQPGSIDDRLYHYMLAHVKNTIFVRIHAKSDAREGRQGL